MTVALLAGFAATTVALATPLILAAHGEVIVEKAGMINVGIEGMMLTGAFAAFVAASATGSALCGLAAAVAAGVALAAVFALLCLLFKADQVVVGTAINILALGVTGVLYKAYQARLPVMGPHAAVLPLPIPGLAHIPLIGQAFFAQDALGYLAFALVPICWFFLAKTRPGLALRAAGEFPQAAEAAGFRIERLRLVAILFGGATAALGGAYLSIAYTSGFAQGMSGGKGFIALAVTILGRWSPVGALIAGLLFGLVSALQFGFQASNSPIPYQVFLALPYLLTLAALVFRSGKVAAPAALGLVFERV